MRGVKEYCPIYAIEDKENILKNSLVAVQAETTVLGLRRGKIV